MLYEDYSAKKNKFAEVQRGQKPKSSLKSTDRDFVINKKKPTLEFLNSGSRGQPSVDRMDSKGSSGNGTGFFFKKQN